MNRRDRRKGPDILIKTINFFTVLSWFGFLLLIIGIDHSKPEVRYGLLVYKGIEVRDHWLAAWLPWIQGGLLAVTAVSLVMILLDMRRTRRKTDLKHYSLYFLTVLALICINYVLGSS